MISEIVVDEWAELFDIPKRGPEESLDAYMARLRAHWESSKSEDLDTRWRPQHTCPRDGTPVELMGGSGGVGVFQFNSESEYGKRWTCLGGNPAAMQGVGDFMWRPAHPEWNEKGTHRHE